mmetsp:Transcript_16855/g.54477  ORF Transcript_16855/g.54477 Transcript_16855/m.54477 type:complete len:295 (-) Transcript_16855:17-901(-)
MCLTRDCCDSCGYSSMQEVLGRHLHLCHLDLQFVRERRQARNISRLDLVHAVAKLLKLQSLHHPCLQVRSALVVRNPLHLLLLHPSLGGAGPRAAHGLLQGRLAPRLLSVQQLQRGLRALHAVAQGGEDGLHLRAQLGRTGGSLRLLALRGDRLVRGRSRYNQDLGGLDEPRDRSLVGELLLLLLGALLGSRLHRPLLGNQHLLLQLQLLQLQLLLEELLLKLRNLQVCLLQGQLVLQHCHLGAGRVGHGSLRNRGIRKVVFQANELLNGTCNLLVLGLALHLAGLDVVRDRVD